MMIRALWSGASGMKAQQTNIDVIANDLTNVNTVGYKKTDVTFADLFYQQLRAAGSVAANENDVPVGIQVGNGVKVTGTVKLFSQGTPKQTYQPTNMMIQDGGSYARNFFPVEVGDKTLYTRDGSFTKDNDGYLTLPSGARLANITIADPEATNITITEEGRIYYTDGAGDQQDAGRLQLATFANPGGLSPLGNNMFEETTSSGTATLGDAGTDGFGSILGQWVEVSNVDAIDEMVKMISAQRAYEFNSRSIQTSDEMLQTVNGLKR